MRIRPFTLILILLGVFGGAEQAFAWGPAMHVGFASTLLEQVGLLPIAVASIISRHGLAYVYGNVAADIVFAKRLSRVRQFCHHWSTGFRLLRAAPDDCDKAFAFGYLSHLAADTVAHGKFIPRQVSLSQCSMNFGHFFWELRADALQDDATWDALRSTLRSNHDDHHRTLADHITDTFLPFELNRVVFERSNAFAAREGFRRTIGLWNQFSRNDLSPTLLDAYKNDCVDRIISVLNDGRKSPVLRDDPNGTSALMQVRAHRRETKRLRRRGLPIKDRIEEATRAFAPQAAA